VTAPDGLRHDLPTQDHVTEGEGALLIASAAATLREFLGGEVSRWISGGRPCSDC
jgi:hypothetical protein